MHLILMIIEQIALGMIQLLTLIKWPQNKSEYLKFKK